MKLKALRARNFLSYKTMDIDFTEWPSLVCIMGRTGAGKSSIIEAMTTALFNRARSSDSKGTGLDDLIKTGEDELEVDFEFETDGMDVRVIRRRSRTAHELELYIDGVSHTEKIRETQAKLESIVRMNYDTFLDTICVGQGKSDAFMRKPPNERKEILTKILGLDRYDVLHEVAKEMRRDVGDRIKELTSRLNDLVESTRLQSQYEREFREGMDEVDRLKSLISNKELELEQELRERVAYEQLVKRRNEILTRRKVLKTKIENVRETIRKNGELRRHYESILNDKERITLSLTQATRTLDEGQDQYLSLNSRKSSLEATNETLLVQVRKIKEQYDRLRNYDAAVCEFCGQEITTEHKRKHLDERMSEGKRLLGLINDNKARINELNSKLSSVSTIISNTRSTIQELQGKRSQIEQAEVKLTNVINRLGELEDELREHEREYHEVTSLKLDDIEGRIFHDDTLRREINELRKRLTDRQNRIAIVENELKRIERNREQIRTLEDEIDRLREEFSLLDENVIAFGKDGIQALIIENTLPEIQREINEVLGILGDGQISVEFVTQRERGKGKKTTVIETLEIMVQDQEGLRPYSTYSGGEAFRVDLACHVGLAKFLARRAGSTIDFFIVDEGVGTQDDVGRERFVTIMNRLTTVFDKVMVITHIQEIMDAFNGKVEVHKDPISGSTLRLINK